MFGIGPQIHNLILQQILLHGGPPLHLDICITELARALALL